MAKKPAPPPDPDHAATTVMNDATRLAQKDAPAANAGSTQFLKDAVSEEEKKNRTTIDGKEQPVKSAMRNLASDQAQVVSTQRAGSMTEEPAKPRNRARTLLAFSAALLAALLGFVLLSSRFE